MIDESTPPAPITPYGREKLAQEAVVARLSEAGVMRTVACRFTNVYGLAGGRLRRKGLVPALVECRDAPPARAAVREPGHAPRLPVQRGRGARWRWRRRMVGGGRRGVAAR